MKKIYSTALAALCALSVSATINVGQLHTDAQMKGMSALKTVAAPALKNAEDLVLSTEAPVKTLPKFSVTAKNEKAVVKKNFSSKKVAPLAEAADYTSIEGEYTITIGDYYWQNSVGQFKRDATVTLAGNTVIIECDYFPTPIGAAYNTTNGELTFSNIEFGETQIRNEANQLVTVYARLEPLVDVNQSGPVTEDYTATYNPNTNKITFPKGHGFVWALYENEDYTVAAGYIDAFDVEGMKKKNDNGEIDYNDIEGEYVAYLGDFYLNNATNSVLSKVAEIEQDGESVTITCDFFPAAVEAAYNEETGTLSFTKVKLGQQTISGATYFVRFEPFHYYEVEEDVDGEMQTVGKVEVIDFTAQYNKTDGSISFPADHGFRWVAYTDSRYSTSVGFLKFFDVNGMERYIDPWVAIGTGTFTDNSLTYLFGKESETYEVEVFQNSEEPALYRVDNPWKGLYAALKFNAVSPSIVLDAANPDNVLLELTTTGINGGSQAGVYYVFNDGWYQLNMASEPDVPEGYTTLTDVDGVLTFTFEPKSLLVFAATSKQIYYAGSNNTSTLVIKTEASTGLNEVTVADENAPVEYYNLQGVRIENPAAGQVVIKRQGTTVSKTFVR